MRLARPGRPGSAPGGPRCPGAVFSEDAQPRLAVGKTKTREGERPASGHTVSEAGAGAEVPAGTSSLARGLRRRGKRLGSEQRGGVTGAGDAAPARVRPRQHPASAPAGPPPGRQASPPCRGALPGGVRPLLRRHPVTCREWHPARPAPSCRHLTHRRHVRLCFQSLRGAGSLRAGPAWRSAPRPRPPLPGAGGGAGRGGARQCLWKR